MAASVAESMLRLAPLVLQTDGWLAARHRVRATISARPRRRNRGATLRFGRHLTRFGVAGAPGRTGHWPRAARDPLLADVGAEPDAGRRDDADAAAAEAVAADARLLARGDDDERHGRPRDRLRARRGGRRPAHGGHPSAPPPPPPPPP